MNPNRPQKPTGLGSGFHPRDYLDQHRIWTNFGVAAQPETWSVADDGVNKQGAVDDVGLGVVDVTPVGVARRGPIFAVR